MDKNEAALFYDGVLADFSPALSDGLGARQSLSLQLVCARHERGLLLSEAPYFRDVFEAAVRLLEAEGEIFVEAICGLLRLLGKVRRRPRVIVWRRATRQGEEASGRRCR